MDLGLEWRPGTGDGGTGMAAAMGLCTALAVLSKWLALPIVALNLFSLLRASHRRTPTFRWSLVAYALAAAIPATLLLSRLSLPHVAEGLALQRRDAPGLARTVALPHQRPFLLHHALVFGLGTLGLAVMFSLQPQVRAKLAAVLATLALMALLIAAPVAAATQSGVSFVSGGIGENSVAALKAREKEFNLKLIFTLTEGNYLADVGVRITDAAGRLVVEHVTDGPIFMARLPAGAYNVQATYNGKA